MILDILKMAQKWPKILTRIVGSDGVRGKRNDECEQGDHDTSVEVARTTKHDSVKLGRVICV